MSSSAAVRRAGGAAARAHSSSSIVAEAVDGSHVFTIHGYSWTKGLGNGKYIAFATFNVGGYGWIIMYYPDGYAPDNADWISFFVQSNREVKARLQFSLLDHVGEPVSSYIMGGDDILTVGPKHKSWGFKRFITRKALEESTYLKNDCFRVRCDVTVLKEIRKGTTQFVTVPPSYLHQHVVRLLSSEVEADVAFLVSAKTFAAHRLVLGARSSVFMAELFGPMKEKNIGHIQIDDMEPRVSEALLHYVYTDSLPEMDEGDTLVMAQHLLVAANRYALERLKLICEGRLCSYIDDDTLASTLALAEQHGCNGLKEACFEVAP